jgi:hypothetical protein
MIDLSAPRGANERRSAYAIAEALAEQKRVRDGEIDAVVLKTIATVLTSFGINDDDRRELRADLSYLRRWRKSVELVQSYTFRAIITVIVTGFLGLVWLGVKAAFDR